LTQAAETGELERAVQKAIAKTTTIEDNSVTFVYQADKITIKFDKKQAMVYVLTKKEACQFLLFESEEWEKRGWENMKKALASHLVLQKHVFFLETVICLGLYALAA
jgi:hypothetical protein